MLLVGVWEGVGAVAESKECEHGRCTKRKGGGLVKAVWLSREPAVHDLTSFGGAVHSG